MAFYIQLRLEIVTMDAPCAERCFLRGFFFPFTPYGYKFEEIDAANRIFEQYGNDRNVMIRWLDQSPWRLVKSGTLSLFLENIQNLNSEGMYWSKSVNITNSVYDLAFSSWGVYSASYDQRWYGHSVR